MERIFKWQDLAHTSRQMVFCLTFLLLCGMSIGNAAMEVGFICLGDKGNFTEPALAFAEKTFKTKQLAKADLQSATFKQFGVIWWHDGDSDPGGLSNAEIDAFLDYAESGGAVLLTGAAIRYATLLGLEDAQPRKFGPVENDGSNVGIIVLKETLELGLVDGLKNVDGKTPKVDDWIQVNSTGYPVSGDYFDTIWENFTTLAHAWEQGTNYKDRIAAFGYWEAGAGKVFNMNWRLPNYHKNNEDIEQLEKLTENVINWLASESEYAAVSAGGKLPIVWGRLKNSH
ncbi:hypothetical protein F4X88_06425 [Candidatus Poribacteria bacterium]|nr:hypothetical protein [Candidatus Poribacteria bacterium]MYA55908.1 hypothetical protein [Candidatus Poribacteria bacterium]